MIFTDTILEGATIIDLEPREDHRGFFARGWCKEEFKANGLNPEIVQLNIGYSRRKGTLRGLHFQTDPWAEEKTVRCTQGAIYDVIIDLRPDSPTFKQWIGVELTQYNYKMLYVPKGFAQGYLTLTDDAEMYYQTSQFYAPEFATGVRFDDPAFGIDWPVQIEVISDQDSSWPDYSD